MFFVPKGQSKSSLAVYCLEWVRERNRPVGHGVIGVDGIFYQLER